MARAGQSLFGLMIGLVAAWVGLRLLIFGPLEMVFGKLPANMLLVMIGCTIAVHGMNESRYGTALLGAMLVALTAFNYYA